MSTEAEGRTLSPKRFPVTDDIVWCDTCENYHLPNQHDLFSPEARRLTEGVLAGDPEAVAEVLAEPVEGRTHSLNGHTFGPYHYAGMGNTERECLTCHFRQDEQLEDERVPPCTSGRVPSPKYRHADYSLCSGDESCDYPPPHYYTEVTGRGLSSAEGAYRMGDNRRVARCSGGFDCAAAVHIHGCYADYGGCDEPDQHYTEAEGLHLNPSLDMQ